MSDFFTGMLRSLAAKDGSAGLYTASKAISKWIDENVQEQEENNQFNVQGINYDPVTGRPVQPETKATSSSLLDWNKMQPHVQADRLKATDQNEAIQRQQIYEAVNRRQQESEAMIKQLHEGLTQFMNSGNPNPNPNPNAAKGNNPIPPRKRYIEPPVRNSR